MAVNVPGETAGDAAEADAAAGETVAPVCQVCGTEALTGEMYCENCGSPLPGVVPAAEPEAAPAGAPGVSDGAPGFPAAAATQPIDAGPAAVPCGNCGGSTFQDGYCSTCGAPAVKERDHWQEQPAPWVAGTTDRGIRHHRNEDAMALSAGEQPGGRAVLVVCDGVSSSMDPDLASLAAARAARDVLTDPAPGGPSIAGRISHWSDLLVKAAAAANDQAVEVSRHPSRRPGERDSPPSCTFVAAVVDGPVVVAGWVGDSRAYWLPDDGGAEMLSVDDSWASEQIQSGVSREEAESAPHAHAITRWLGVDSPDFEPRCSSTTPRGAGWLLVCSDGLWNYCSAAQEMGALVAAVASEAGGDPARTASDLVDWANAQGGMDNITVALARLDPRSAT